MIEIDVLDYSVRLGPGLLARTGSIVGEVARAHRYVIITDEHVAGHWLATVVRSFEPMAAGSVLSRVVPAGEAQKTRDTWAALTDWMLDSECGRDTTVVALGGGVVGDVAGFVAATFMRGVPLVQVPTTLLAMVDAAIGGKTGVDTPAGKNLVGAFHQPAVVLTDPLALATLPAAHLRAGMAEVLKHGAVADAALFDAAAAFGASLHEALVAQRQVAWDDDRAIDILRRSIGIKCDVVRRDERESGLRQVLNAGHTVAHAVELVSEYRCLHGEAVAIGLVTEAHLAERVGIAAPGTAARLEDALGGAGLPTRLRPAWSVDALVRAMAADKKGRGGRLGFALLESVGRPAGDPARGWASFVAESDVRTALRDMVAEDGAIRAPAFPPA